MKIDLSRRRFLQSVAATATLAGLSPRALAATNTNSKLRVLSIGVIGTIGGHDRKQVASHPMAEIVGLCDVDSQALAKASTEHPDAFTCADYREAFANHGDDFDAVIVATPDHTHAAIMLMALANGKHVYGQKPLVQQLDEIVMMEKAMAARPDLVTQLGNQRMVFPGRRAFIDILKAGQLGKALEAHVWVGSPNSRDYFNLDRKLEEPVAPPDHLNWDLWLGPTPEAPYRPGMCPVVWRSWWDYGTNGLGDWGCHVLDVLFFAYPELLSPATVLTHCQPSPQPAFHTHPCRSTLTYQVESPRFARTHFPIYYSDSGQAPSRASLGLPPGSWPDQNMTVIVCEGGVMTLTAGGRLVVWRDGKPLHGLKMPDLPEYGELNHWHAWVDNCLGKKTLLQTPFPEAIRMTEAALLAVKATRFPGQELVWDKPSMSFSNQAEATKTIVGREWRKEFLPPDFS